ncbi:hypothetical protein JW905_14360, partial [bacterium]|nr:hypothetical protein [candidate division CSSED10-310 bacterium]
VMLSFPGYGPAAGEMWVRVTSTVNPISGLVPIPWDGSVATPFQFGETEDYLITIPGQFTPTPTRTPSPTPGPIPAAGPGSLLLLLTGLSILIGMEVKRRR